VTPRSGPALQRAISDYSKALHARGWVANHDGNVSARLPDDARFMATPTALSKREIEPHQILTVDLDGKVLSGRLRVFSEWHLHRACYRARPDARAVLHAHPPHATAFGAARVPLGTPALPEVIVSLGEVPLIDYAAPKSKAQDEAIAAALQGEADALLLAGNGVLVVGDDLEQAYLRLELVEHYAQIAAIARGLGGAVPVPPADVNALLDKRASAGLGRGRR
jgi:L-fuculose-phosphate aldolase